MPKSEESPDIALATSVADRISIGDEKIAIRQVDAALQFLRQEEPVGQLDEIAEKKLLRKIDWLIMPLLFGCYLFQYMDKSLSMSPSHHKTLMANVGQSIMQTSWASALILI
jgi:protein gp37